MSNLIGICGLKRSGKDTVASFLVHHYGFERYSFADPMKEACKELFLLDEEQVNGDKKAEVDSRWNVTPRKLLQVMGTELFQYDIHEHMEEGEFDVGRAVWVKRFEFWYKENSHKDIVISDVRFQHEADKVKELGGEIWKVDREEVKNEGDLHASERELLNIQADYYINNDGGLNHLYEQVDHLFTEREH